jgi:hypothetical protein
MEFIGWGVWLQGERQKLNGNGKTVAPRQAKAVPSPRTPNYGNGAVIGDSAARFGPMELAYPEK